MARKEREVWRKLASCKGNTYEKYSVSSFGRVRRDRGQWGGKSTEMKLTWSGSYRAVRVMCDGKSPKAKTRQVHVMVAEVFIGPCPQGCVLTHRDFDRDNNRSMNLEYVTRAEATLRRVQYRKLRCVSVVSSLGRETVDTLCDAWDRCREFVDVSQFGIVIASLCEARDADNGDDDYDGDDDC